MENLLFLGLRILKHIRVYPNVIHPFFSSPAMEKIRYQLNYVIHKIVLEMQEVY